MIELSIVEKIVEEVIEMTKSLYDPEVERIEWKKCVKIALERFKD